MNIVVLIVLILFSIQDVKDKKLSLIPLCIVIVVSVLYYLCQVYLGRESLTSMLWNQMPGFFFLGMALWNSNKIGPGDGLTLLFLGNSMGYEATMFILLIALIMSVVYSIVMLILGKVKIDSTIPFVPFLCIGCMGYLILTGVMV